MFDQDFALPLNVYPLLVKTVSEHKLGNTSYHKKREKNI